MLEKCPKCNANVVLPALGELHTTVTCQSCATRLSLADFSIQAMAPTDVATAATQPTTTTPSPSLPPVIQRPAATAPAVGQNAPMPAPQPLQPQPIAPLAPPQQFAPQQFAPQQPTSQQAQQPIIQQQNVPQPIMPQYVQQAPHPNSQPSLPQQYPPQQINPHAPQPSVPQQYTQQYAPQQYVQQPQQQTYSQQPALQTPQYPRRRASDMATSDPKALASLMDDRTEPTALELESVGAQGYDDRVIVPSGFGIGSALRCMIGAVWALATLQLVGWWFLDADPIKLAQYVPPSIAFILPEDMRSEAVKSQELIEETEGELASGNSQVSKDDSDLFIEDSPGKPDQTTVANGFDSTYDGDLQIATPKQRPNATPRAPTENPPAVTANGSNEPSIDLDLGHAFASKQNEQTAPPSPDASPLVFESPTGAATNETIAQTGSSAVMSSTASNAQGAAGGAAVPDYVATAVAPPRLHPESVFEDHGPKWAKEFVAADVEAAVAAARNTNREFERARLLGAADKKRSAQLNYAICCKLAERATMVKQEGAQNALTNSREYFRELTFNPATVRMFSNAAINWMAKDLGKGLVVAAKVNDIRPVGDVFELNVKLLDRAGTFETVVTRMNPGNNPWAEFAIGDTLLIAGVKVNDPEVRLPGYLGNALSVIYVTDQIIRIQ